MREDLITGYIMARPTGSTDRFHVLTPENGEAVTSICGETLTGYAGMDVRTSMRKGSVCPICMTVIRMKNRGDV